MIFQPYCKNKLKIIKYFLSLRIQNKNWSYVNLGPTRGWNRSVLCKSVEGKSDAGLFASLTRDTRFARLKLVDK